MYIYIRLLNLIRETIGYMRKLLPFLLVLFTSVQLTVAHEHNDVQSGFIINKGQFPDQVTFKKELVDGSLFLEKNKFTFHLYDADLIAKNHANPNTFPDDSIPQIQHHAYQMEFIGASTQQIEGIDQLKNYYNYFLGNDPKRWASKVGLFEEVRYHDIYPGIDLRFYQDGDILKYDFIVSPNTSTEKIQWKYNGVETPEIKGGNIQIETSLGRISEYKPYAYQVVEGEKEKVTCKFSYDGGSFFFEFPKGWDQSKELIIDPALIFSTYSGSTANNFGYTATFDSRGYLYSGSSAFGNGYPTTMGAFQVTWGGGTGGSGIGLPGLSGTDIVITKWDTNGSAPIYSTYLGGSSDELPHSLVVDNQENLLILGTTSSLNFPTTTGVINSNMNFNFTTVTPVNLVNGLGVYYPNGSDLTVTKLDSTGSSLLASTYLGGTDNDGLNTGTTKFNYADEIRGEIEVDNENNIYIASCTRSNDNPATQTTSFQSTKPTQAGNLDAILYCLNAQLSQVKWLAYYGGANADAAYSLALNSSNEIYLTGGTNSANLPMVGVSYDQTHNGGIDGYVAHISSDGSTLLKSTYFGSTNYDQSYFVESDADDYCYIFGQTSAPTNQLIFNCLYYDINGGQFVTKFGPQLDSIVWSTRFGRGDGNPDISPTAFLVDLCSSVYLSGWGSAIVGGSLTTNGLDTAGGPLQGTTDNNDFYLAVLADDASQLQYATYFGGSAAEHVDGGTSRFDRKGKIYQAVCAGCGGTNDFPTTSGAYSSTNNAGSSCNLAVFKIDFLLPMVVSDFLMPEKGCSPFQVDFDNVSLTQSATTFYWDFGDGNNSTLSSPSHTYNTPGVYNVTLVVSDLNSCNLTDTLTKSILIGGDTNYSLANDTVCSNTDTKIGFINSVFDPDVTFSWSPNLYINDSTLHDPSVSLPHDMNYTIYVDNGICLDTVSLFVKVDSIIVDAPNDTSICDEHLPVDFFGNSTGEILFYNWSTSTTDTLNNTPQDSGFTLNNQSIGSETYYFYAETPRGCSSLDSFEISINNLQNPLIADFDNPGEGCTPYSVQFNNQTNGSSASGYYWEFGTGDTSYATNPNYQFDSAGTFTVTLYVIDTSVCTQLDTFMLEIEVDSNTVNYQANLACLDQEIQIGVDPSEYPNSTFNWVQSGLVSDPTISNPTGSFSNDTVLIMVAQGVCTDTLYDSIQVDFIYAETDSLLVTCSDQLPVNLEGNSFGTGTSFYWTESTNPTDTLNSISDSTFSSNPDSVFTTYYFSAETQRGCIESDSIQVLVADLSIDVDPEFYICFGDSALLVSNNPYESINPLSYNWQPNEGILSNPDSASVWVSPEVSQTYTLYTVNDSGCTTTDTVQVYRSTLNPVLVNATSDADTVVRATSTNLYATPNQNGYSYQWSPSTSLSSATDPNPEAYPTETTTYVVTVTDISNPNCSYTAQKTIFVSDLICDEPQIFVPNAFTPNGDGLNDEVLVRGQHIREMEFSIYNRWGELVFESSNQSNGWDGYHNGTLANPAVYVYQLDVTCIDEQRFYKKGNITLVR